MGEGWAPASLIVTGPDEIQRYDVWREPGGPTLTATSSVADTHGIVQAGDGLYCVCKGEVLRLDARLNILARRSFADVGAVAALGSGEALVSVGGSLLVLDSQLEEVGRLPLTRDGKNAHDLLIRGAYAYVLDNIVYPALIWIVNLSNQAEPVAVYEGEIEDIYPHLIGQLVPPGVGLWIIFQSGVGRSGRWQNAHAFSALTGEPLGERIPLAMRSRGPGDPGDQQDAEYAPRRPPQGKEVVLANLTAGGNFAMRSGIWVASIDSTGSGWAVLGDEQSGTYVAELVVERELLFARHMLRAPSARAVLAGESHLYLLGYDEARTKGELRIVSKKQGFVHHHATVWTATPERKEPSHWRPTMLFIDAESTA